LGAALLLDYFGFREAAVPLFVCASAISSWYGGQGAAVLAVVLCSLAFDYFFVPPLHTLYIAAAELPYFIIFALFTLLVSWFARSRRRVEEDLRKARDELESLNHQLAQRSERSEASLAESKTRLEEAQQITHVGHWERDLAADRIVWSDETYRIFGLQPQVEPMDLAGLRQRIHPEDWALVSQTLAEALIGGARYYVEYRVLRPTGEVRIVHSQGDVTRDDSGRPTRMFGTVQDITDRKRAEQEREKLRQLEDTLAHIGTLNALTASIAHEINQPLASLITNASICLRRLNLDPPNVEGARETARRTIRDGNRASEVITRLRALFSKKESTREPLDLNEAAREVITTLSDQLQRKRVLLLTDFEADLPGIVGDRTQIQQVIVNLLRNASDAMSTIDDRPRELVISTAREAGQGVRLSVKDAGVGLESQATDRLFQAFYTTKSDGMGIGLSISRSIIEAHQGRLWAASNVGPGATFSFSVPCEQAHPAERRFAIGFLSNGQELHWMPEVLQVLQDEFPDLDVATSTQFSPLLAEALSKGQIDAALLRREEGWPDLAYETLLRERLIVFLPTDHRLAAFQEINPHDLAGERFIAVAKTAPALRRAIDDYLTRSGISIEANHEFDHPTKLMSLIVSTSGVALAPEYGQNFLPASITTRPLIGHPPTVDLVLGYKKSNQSPILKLLISRLGKLVALVTKKEPSELSDTIPRER
jgi:PAS domain S-box-containing protein